MTDTASDTDDTTVSPDESPVPDSDPADEATAAGDSDGRSIARYAQWAAFGILVLVALVASLQFYFAASAAVDEFVTRRYRPLFRAGFNLVVVLAAATGVSLLVRRLA